MRYMSITIILLLSSYSIVSASGSNELISKAEEAWNNQDFENSNILYQQLSEKNTSISETAMYNQALSLFRQNNYDSADKILDGLYNSKNREISEKSMMLGGLNSYRISEKLINESKEIQSALAEIDNSISWFSRLIELDSNNKTASHNLEISRIFKNNLKKAQEQQQEQEKKNKEMQDQLEELKEEQDQLASENQKKSDDHQKQQEDLREKTEDLHNQMGNDNKEAQEEMQKAQEQQKNAIEEMKKGQFVDAEESQNEASEAMGKALDLMKGEESESSEPENSEEEKSDEAKDEKDDISQSIIENEENRESSTNTTGGISNVDRNW